MFKLIMMYSMMLQPNYTTNHIEVVGGFRSQADCQMYGRIMSDAIKEQKGFIKGYGGYQCEKDSK